MRRVYALAAMAASVCLLATCSARAKPVERPFLARLIEEHVSVLDSTTPLLRFTPPPIYTFWRAQVEQCSGLRNDTPISYWVASTVTLGKDGVLGMYVRSNQHIIFGLGNETVDWIVRHEMLHHLVNKPDHPKEYFDVKCAAVVKPGGGS